MFFPPRIHTGSFTRAICRKQKPLIGINCPKCHDFYPAFSWQHFTVPCNLTMFSHQQRAPLYLQLIPPLSNGCSLIESIDIPNKSADTLIFLGNVATKIALIVYLFVCKYIVLMYKLTHYVSRYLHSQKRR